MQKNKKIFIVLASIAAGILSGFLTTNEVLANLSPMNFVAGLLFGITFALFFTKRFVYQLIGFIVTSTFAYWVAFIITVNGAFLFGGSMVDEPLNPLIFFPGGFIGALILLLAVKYFLLNIKSKRLIPLSILGGILGIVGWTAGAFFNSHSLSASDKVSSAHLFTLYILWQGIMTWAIVHSTEILPIAADTSGNTEFIQQPSSISKKITITVMVIGLVWLMFIFLVPAVITPYLNRNNEVCAQEAEKYENDINFEGSSAYCKNKCAEDPMGNFRTPYSSGGCFNNCYQNTYDYYYKKCGGR